MTMPLRGAKLSLRPTHVTMFSSGAIAGATCGLRKEGTVLAPWTSHCTQRGERVDEWLLMQAATRVRFTRVTKLLDQVTSLTCFARVEG